MPKLVDLTGQKFGRLVVIRWARKDKWRQSYWLCRCYCGEEKVVRGNDMKRGKVKSCGCLNIEKIIERSTTHGHRHDKIYGVWSQMIQRCTNPNQEYYKNYGGRGIKVYKRWLGKNGFIHFIEDMKEGYKPGLTLERKNNKLGYSKENCKWADRKEQARNTRRNHLITHNGKTQCLVEWAEELNINDKTLIFRLNRSGWSIEDALTIPVGQKRVSGVH